MVTAILVWLMIGLATIVFRPLISKCISTGIKAKWPDGPQKDKAIETVEDTEINGIPDLVTSTLLWPLIVWTLLVVGQRPKVEKSP